LGPLISAVDVLLFGAHPDDVEWGAGGTALLMKQQGLRFAFVDLSAGEMGSRGTPEARKLEAQAAADFAGASARETLCLPDCGLVDAPETRRLIASTIRRVRPRVVMAPYWEDRHPDHSAAGCMVRNAALFCTLRKFEDQNPPHKPELFLYYLLHNYEKPSLVMDISEVYERKLELLRLHETQFSMTAEQFGLVPQGLGEYLYGLESRDRFFGSLIGCQHGEAFVADRPLRVTNFSRVLSGLFG
jgi:bacillithiol biosynthesis deacetylase BshB1